MMVTEYCPDEYPEDKEKILKGLDHLLSELQDWGVSNEVYADVMSSEESVRRDLETARELAKKFFGGEATTVTNEEVLKELAKSRTQDARVSGAHEKRYREIKNMRELFAEELWNDSTVTQAIELFKDLVVRAVMEIFDQNTRTIHPFVDLANYERALEGLGVGPFMRTVYPFDEEDCALGNDENAARQRP